VIESILFFTLGFLCAGFLALMVAPTIWRRAAALTRKRIEASVPLSLNDIQADKDRMRAEFAMSTRRLEMSIKAFRDKASGQIIEINRNREELKRLASERDEKNQSVSELEARAGELRGELRQREDQLQRLGDRLRDAEKAIEARALELDKIGRLYDEASLTASNRQIELVVRETEVEKLSADVQLLRSQRKDFDRRMAEVVAEGKAARDALKGERKKVTDLERKLERMLTTLTDREEKLDRRERDLARMREQVKGSSGTEHELNEQLVEAQKEKVRLEAELADMALQMQTLLSGAKGGDIEKAMARLSEDRDRMEARLTALTRENKKLRADLSEHERSKVEDWGTERRGNALLREQINDLAAEVVSLTAALEGPESPIIKALAVPQAEPGAGSQQKIISLADRVRALQKVSSAR
jgi:predicted  nucleic acid-binding Zn-ribbon protein